MTFFDLHVPGALETYRPFTSSMFSPINLQHLQFLWFLQGTVLPLFFPRAMDFKTDNLLPTFAPVFFTNWKSGFVASLNEFVLESSSSNFLTVLTNLSSVPFARHNQYWFGRLIIDPLFRTLDSTFHILHFISYTAQQIFGITRFIKGS